ncbi:hypothetical protein [Cupriavidus pinatubonensis]|uniref:hypothetical protein n=1 Tax=Cupriavidus pinatubonensis TaxID=248026 RepID=UPI00112B6527|nr:hypothetical protein [Cupriavidus pinatubonensis]TPQ32028.1 hypothetical protein C2U69_27460 [Cupriavidus pinatubonensis]
MSDDKKALLEWAEKAAVENMKAHHASADFIAKEAATTLTVFLAGMGAAMAYAAKAIDEQKWGWFAVGATAFAAWFLMLSVLLVWKCLMMRPIPPVHNEPLHLYQPAFSLADMQEAELSGYQKRINEAARRNGRLVWWLNRLRLAAAASPLVFIAFAWAAWAKGCA